MHLKSMRWICEKEIWDEMDDTGEVLVGKHGKVLTIQFGI